jgi:hypothetical protein
MCVQNLVKNLAKKLKMVEKKLVRSFFKMQKVVKKQVEKLEKKLIKRSLQTCLKITNYLKASYEASQSWRTVENARDLEVNRGELVEFCYEGKLAKKHATQDGIRRGGM